MTTPGKTTCRLCQRCCRIVVSGDGVGDGLVVNAAGADDTVCRDGVDGGSTVAVSVVTLSPVTLLVPLAPVALLTETVSTVVVSVLTVSAVVVSTVAVSDGGGHEPSSGKTFEEFFRTCFAFVCRRRRRERRRGR